MSMAQELTDKSGAPVSVRIESSGQTGSYIVRTEEGVPAGRADFVDSREGPGFERIFFHTEVDAAFAGRGLAGVLVREALADSIRSGFGVVPVCPLFARHLVTHKDEFLASGGVFRRPSRDDLARVSRVADV